MISVVVFWKVHVCEGEAPMNWDDLMIAYLSEKVWERAGGPLMSWLTPSELSAATTCGRERFQTEKKKDKT